MLIKLLITLKMQNIIASANLKDKKQDEIRNILGPESQVIFEISLDLCALVFHVKVQLVQDWSVSWAGMQQWWRKEERKAQLCTADAWRVHCLYGWAGLAAFIQQAQWPCCSWVALQNSILGISALKANSASRLVAI